MANVELEELLWQLYRHTTVGRIQWHVDQESHEVRADFVDQQVGVARLRANGGERYVLRLYRPDETQLDEIDGIEFEDRGGGLTGVEKLAEIHRMAQHMGPGVQDAARAIIDKLTSENQPSRAGAVAHQP